jgi:hypothetical protein
MVETSAKNKGGIYVKIHGKEGLFYTITSIRGTGFASK